MITISSKYFQAATAAPLLKTPLSQAQQAYSAAGNFLVNFSFVFLLISIVFLFYFIAAATYTTMAARAAYGAAAAQQPQATAVGYATMPG